MSQQVALTLLQFVSLTLPAIAIYMGMAMPTPREQPNVSDTEAANYQNVRMAILQLLTAAGVLLVYLFVFGHFFVLYLAAFLIFVGIATFGLAVLFDSDLLLSDYSIIWGYRNTIHRLTPPADTVEDSAEQ